MSEFYDSRRSAITDLSGLAGFALGALVTSAFAWRLLATGFRTGELERALFLFLTLTLGFGIVGGVMGIAVGRTSGRLWEARHRRRRAPPTEATPELWDGERRADDATVDEPDSASGLTYRAFGIEVDQFLVLLRRAVPGEPNAVRTATHLGRTINIGAWDGPRLVGAARILTDGLFAHVAEVLVDPAYVSRGVEAALRERAERVLRSPTDV